MDITITINTDNAAFGDDPSGEVAIILRDLADRIDRVSIDGICPQALRDGNGNVVGQIISGGA